MTGPTLTSKVVRSARWVFAGRLLGRGVELVKALVLARLLAPEDFGLFGLTMLAMFVFDVFSQTGMNAALIQRSEVDDEFLDTAWTIQTARGAFLAAALFLVSPLVARFFGEPRIEALVRAIALVPLLQGFVNIGVIFFEKEMRFHRQFVYDAVAALVSLAVGVACAVIWRSVWALVAANVVLAACRLALSYALHPYRPRLRLSGGKARALFAFGKWMTGYSITLFAWQQLDKLVVGKLLGPVALGLYQIAQRVADLPASQVATASVSFTFPAYAKLQGQGERLGKAFLDVVETVLSVTLPISVFIITGAPEIVFGLLGARWEGAILPMRLLAVVGMLNAVDTLATPLFVSVGRPKLEFARNLSKLLVMAAAIVPLARAFGVTGVCAALVLGSCGAIPVWVKVMAVAEVRGKDLLGRVMTPLLLGAVVAAAPPAVRALSSGPGALSLAGSVLIGALLYLGAALALGTIAHRGIWVLAVRMRHSVRR